MSSLRGRRVMELAPSELGTESYWNEFYNRELDNFKIDNLTTGTEWFSDVKAGKRMILFVKEKIDKVVGGIPNAALDHIKHSILDLGTGNGHLLFELCRRNIGTTWHGVDYSDEAIALARELATVSDLSLPLYPNGATDEGYLDAHESLLLQVYNIMADDAQRPAYMPELGYDFILDKGTFDAISLSAAVDSRGIRSFRTYIQRVGPLLSFDGRLVITSCNWTEDELKHWMLECDVGGLLVFECSIKYPVFRFGGSEGQSVVTVVFQRIPRSPDWLGTPSGQWAAMHD